MKRRRKNELGMETGKGRMGGGGVAASFFTKITILTFSNAAAARGRNELNQ